MKLAVGGGLLLVAVLCIVMAVKGVMTRSQETEPETTFVSDIPSDSTLTRDVKVDGLTLKAGTAFDEARDKILKQYEWGMTVSYEGEKFQVENLIEGRLKDFIEHIYEDASQPAESQEQESQETASAQVKEYNLDVSGLDAEIKKQVADMASKWDKPAKNGRIDSFDKEKEIFIYAGEEKGVVIDQTQLAADIQSALNKTDFKASITAKGNAVDPEITEAKAKEMYQVVGQYTTTTTSNADRNTNIRLATEALNGMIIPSGGEFSFNKTTGNRTTQKGYRPAGAYVNGILVEEPGGGVCQVSSTLYNAVVFAGLDIVERHPHSYEPSYVTPGEDAMVSYDGYTGPDMRFKNNSSSAIAIRGKFVDRKLTISIVSIPIVEDGVKVSMSSKKTSEVDPPATPTYEENPTLEPGVEIEVKKPTKGSVWETKVIKKKSNGEEEVIKTYTSRYKGKGATIQRNTSGTVLTTAASSVEESTVETVPSETAPVQTNPDGSAIVGPGASQPGATVPSTQESSPDENNGGPGSGGGPGVSDSGAGDNGSDGGYIAPNPMGPGGDSSGP